MNDLKIFMEIHQIALIWIACVAFFWALIMASNNQGLRWRISFVRFLALAGTLFWVFYGETISGYGNYDIWVNFIVVIAVIFIELFAFIALAWVFGMKDKELVAKILG